MLFCSFFFFVQICAQQTCPPVYHHQKAQRHRQVSRVLQFKMFFSYHMANWSNMKRRFLIGALNGLKSVIRAAKIHHSRNSFSEFLSLNTVQNIFTFTIERKLLLNFTTATGKRKANIVKFLSRAFTKNRFIDFPAVF